MPYRTHRQDRLDLHDRAEIEDLLVRYCRGADRCDPDLVRSAYHPDAHDDRGYWRGNGHEFAVFITDRLAAANNATTHSLTNVLIEVDGDEATSESQVRATLVRRDSDTADAVAARYLDRLSRRNGVWRIDRRTVGPRLAHHRAGRDVRRPVRH